MGKKLFKGKSKKKQSNEKVGLKGFGQFGGMLEEIAPNLALLPTLSEEEVKNVDFTSEFPNLKPKEKQMINNYMALIHKKHHTKTKKDRAKLDAEMEEIMKKAEK